MKEGTEVKVLNQGTNHAVLCVGLVILWFNNWNFVAFLYIYLWFCLFPTPFKKEENHRLLASTFWLRNWFKTVVSCHTAADHSVHFW
jgi:hypothetical protein